MKKSTIFLLILFTAAVLLTACGETLALDRDQLEMVVGDSVELSAGNAAKVSWTSSDPAVATVSGGLVSAKSAGVAVITASRENGNQATCQVTVADKLINVLTIDVKSARIEAGKTIQLSVSYAPADASDKRITWESSDDSVATVDENGYVTGVSEGVAEISCKSANGVKASCTVTVGATPTPTSAATLPPATEAPTQEATEKPQTDETQKAESETQADAPASAGTSSGMIFPDSSTRYLTADEVSEKLSAMSGSPVSDSFAQDAINEIYARNGYVFRTPAIRDYYQSQSWYRPDQSYDGSLSEVELANIGLLSSY